MDGEFVGSHLVHGSPPEPEGGVTAKKSGDDLAHFKCPTSVEFIEALPRTATGKLQKFRLRQEYWGDGARKVAG